MRPCSALQAFQNDRTNERSETFAEKLLHYRDIQKVVTQLAQRLLVMLPHQYWDQLIVALQQCGLCINVDHFHRKNLRGPKLLQSIKHILTEMAVRTGIDDEVCTWHRDPSTRS